MPGQAGGDDALERAVKSGKSGLIVVRGSSSSSRLPGSWYFGPTLWESVLILMGCTLLALAGWVGFTFCRRKSYADLPGRRHRSNYREEADGVELP